MAFYGVNNLSVIWQKGESQNGGNKKESTPNFRKTNTSNPLIRARIDICRCCADIILKTVKTSKNLFYFMITLLLSIFDTEMDEKVYAYLLRII